MYKFFIKNFNGTLIVPGDESISHRAFFLSSLAEKEIKIKGVTENQDILHTIDILKKCNINISKKNKTYFVKGNSLYGLSEPDQVLNAGRSGTTLRIACGLLGPQNFYSILTGDKTITNKSIESVIIPLSNMGIKIYGKKNNTTPPVTILPCSKVKGTSYKLPFSSAQVKSSILFSSLYSNKETIIYEPVRSRDHTERMFEYFNIPIKLESEKITIFNKTQNFKGKNLTIPGDFSIASYYIIGALISPKSRITIKNVGLNLTRTGALNVLKRMGAKIEIKNTRKINNEMVGDITAISSNLIGAKIKTDEIPLLIDEIPILSIAAVAAQGRTTFMGSKELRKTDQKRLKTIIESLIKSGVPIKDLQDGFTIKGDTKLNTKNKTYSFNDHKIALSFIIASILSDTGVSMKNIDPILKKYPNFNNDLRKVSK